MGSYKDYQENINPLQDIKNLNHSSLRKSEPPRTILSIPKPQGTSSKPKIKNIQYYDKNVFLSTSTFELEISQRPKASISNKFAKRPVTGGMPPNFEHISQLNPNPSSKTAEVAIQQKEMHKDTPPPKRQRLEEVDDTDDICIIEENIKRPGQNTDRAQDTQSHNNIQVTPTITIESIPANLTIHTAPNVPPKVANTPRGLEREQQNNGIHSLARNPTQNNDKEFFDSLKLDNINLRKKNLRDSECKYRDNVNGITISEAMQELKKEINILKQGIEQSERIRLDICDSKSIIISGKYTCKKCLAGYKRPGNIVKHILAFHPEIVEEYKPAQINNAASTVVDDRDETCTLTSHSHSINSQLTLFDSNVSPHGVASAASFSTSQSHSIHSQDTLLNNNKTPNRGLSSASSTTSTHSIHSQRTVLNNNVQPHRKLSADSNIRGDKEKYIPVSRGGDKMVNTSTPSAEPIPVKPTNPGTSLQNASERDAMTSVSTEPLPANATNARAHLQNVVEIRQDNPFWKRIDINFSPRKPVNFLGHESFELFEKHQRMIRNWIKKPRSNNFATSTNKSKNSASQHIPKRNNLNLYDGSAQVKKYKLDLLYNKAELQIIKHCYIDKKTDDLCKSCANKLVEFQAKQYALSKAAYDEHEKISKDRSLSSQEKKRKIKELVSTKDEYSLIRERLNKVNAERGSFDLIPVVVQYNRNYFLLLQKAFNDMNIRDSVQLDQSNLSKYNFGIYCSKLMDDIVNEFLVQVTVICMNFAYRERKVTLTKELLSEYQVFFKMTNKDATYLEPCTPDVQNFFEKNYSNFLPNTDVLEILIVDCLLRRCFSDENTMHEGLDELIFEHLKSPQPIFKFLMYMKFTKPYLEMIRDLLLKFLFQLSVEVLNLKKEKNSHPLVTFEELIEACEIVGVFGSSYIHYLRKAYMQYFKETIGKMCGNIIDKNFVLNSDGLLTKKRTTN